jgi:hypothetical protein
MGLYKYTAIITKNMVLQGEVTFTDRRSSAVTMCLPLNSECKTGHVLGESPDQATCHAITELTRFYPVERGYDGHDSVSLESVEEIDVLV